MHAYVWKGLELRIYEALVNYESENYNTWNRIILKFPSIISNLKSINAVFDTYDSDKSGGIDLSGMYICIYVYMYICMYLYMYVCMYVRMYVCVCVYVCIPVRG